jgi:hypothetical protein
LNVSQEQANRIIVGIGCAAFFGPVVSWPITSWTIWKDQPQGVMALSWIAIILTGAVLLLEGVNKTHIDDK